MHIFPNIILKEQTSFQGISVVNILDESENDSKNESLILKEIPITDSSYHIITLNSLFTEAMITHNFRTNLLNSSKKCFIRDNKLQLFLPLAEGILSFKYNRPKELLIEWIKTLVHSILYLHRRRLIHGDIKEDNVLVFEKEIKLADFGMTTLILEGDDQVFPPHVKMYTATHRPPEVWGSNTWGFKADIWSLGCTIFELIYGYSLFPPQKTEDDYINCLNDWFQGKFTSFSYNPIILPQEWDRLEYQKINHLIISMLNFNPIYRPSIFELVQKIDIDLFETVKMDRIIPESEVIKYGSSPTSIVGLSMNYISNIPNNSIQYHYYSIDKIRCISLQKSLKEIIPKLVKSNNIILIDLISSLFEQVNDDKNMNIKILRACATIIHHIVYRTGLPFYVYTYEDVKQINKISNKVNFNYINWTQFYHTTV